MIRTREFQNNSTQHLTELLRIFTCNYKFVFVF